MIARLQHYMDINRNRSYFLASGRVAGRQVLAEGDTRREAIEEWTTAAAERQALIDGRRAYERFLNWLGETP